MDLYDKAKELGTMIVDSEEFKNLKVNEAALESDEKSITLMTDYQNIQNELMGALQENKESEVINEIRDRFMAKQTEISEYDVTVGFLNARSEFENMMKKVNDIISYVVKGVDGEEDGCGTDGCSGCSGCGH